MELRECPCGNTDVDFRFDEGDCRPPADPWSIFCSNMECAWEFGWFPTKEAAAKEWSTRASDATNKELVEALGNIIELLDDYDVPNDSVMKILIAERLYAKYKEKS